MVVSMPPQALSVLWKTSMLQVQNVLMVGLEEHQVVTSCTEAHQLKTWKQQGIINFVTVHPVKAW